ncbi:MAG: hypothetical protein R2731_12475 [Nocardioides sp.]
MNQPHTTGRPGTVTTVVVLTGVAGLVDIIAGAALWALSGSDRLRSLTDASQGTITAQGIAFIVLGVIALGLAVLLGSGSKAARTLVSVLMVLRIAGVIWVVSTTGWGQAGEVLPSALLAFVVLGFLWNKRAGEFFG